MRCGEEKSAILICPYHTDSDGRQNKPRNRNPLVHCCHVDSVQHVRHHCHSHSPGDNVRSVKMFQSDVRHSQLVLRNIRIPASYYTTTDPRHMSSDVIKQLTIIPGDVNHNNTADTGKLVTLSRSSSNVSVRRAEHVRLSTSRPVTRSQSVRDQRPTVMTPVLGPVGLTTMSQVTRSQSVSEHDHKTPIKLSTRFLPAKMSATLSQNTLPWEYKVAGIGTCWQGMGTISKYELWCSGKIACKKLYLIFDNT